MAYSATLANMRGLLSDEEHKRILNLFSRAGLSMDHQEFDEDILDKGTKAILKTRDGLLRAAVPSPVGKCVFLNDVSMDEMFAALKKHKALMKNYPRNGEGLEAFVDSSDTGYTVNNKPVETNGISNGISNGLKKLKVLNDDTHVNGAATNGHQNADGKMTNGVAKATKHAAAEEKPTGLANGATDVPTNGFAKGIANGVNGHTNGVHTNGTNGVH
jgi:3-dehydroquinate synthase